MSENFVAADFMADYEFVKKHGCPTCGSKAVGQAEEYWVCDTCCNVFTIQDVEDYLARLAS